MRGQQLNSATNRVVVALSLTALLAVLCGYFLPPQADEGAAAHIFQFAIAALVPTILLFLATADRARPARIVRQLLLPTAVLVVAFGALYYQEHYR